jgi:hypothetical protein
MNDARLSSGVSDFRLELFLLGELPADEKRDLETLLASDAGLRARLAAIRAHDPVFASAYPAREMVSEIGDRLRAARLPARVPAQPPSLAERLSGFLPRAPGLRLAGAFALVMLAAVPVVLQFRSATEESRLKGIEAGLALYRSTPAGPERIRPGAVAAAGDVIQIEFQPAGSAHGAIVSVDANGKVTRHWPPPGDGGTDLTRLPGRRLPNAFRLDDAPGFERFYFLHSPSPFALASLEKALAESARHEEGWLAGRLPAPLRAAAFTLKKGP